MSDILDLLKSDSQIIMEQGAEGTLQQQSAASMVADFTPPEETAVNNSDVGILDVASMHFQSTIRAGMIWGARQLVKEDQNYNVWNDPALSNRDKSFLLDHFDDLADSPNANWTVGLLATIDKNEYIKKNASGSSLILGEMLSAVTDITNLLPVAGLAGNLKTLGGTAKAVGEIAAVNTWQEVMNGRIDPTQTAGDTAINAAMGTAFAGGLIGALGIARATPEIKQSIDRLFNSNTIDDLKIEQVQQGSAGAMQNIKFDTSDNDLVSTNFISDSITRATSIYSKESELALSESPTVRELGRRLTASGFIEKRHLEGRVGGDSIQAQYEVKTSNANFSLQKALKKSYELNKREGGKLSQNDFFIKARNYILGIDDGMSPGVKEAADAFKKNFKDAESIVKRSGKVPEGWAPKQGYFHVQYDFDKLSKNQYSLLNDIKLQLANNPSAKAAGIDDLELESSAREIMENMILRADGRDYKPSFNISPLKKVVLDFDNGFKTKYMTDDVIGSVFRYNDDIFRQEAMLDTFGANNPFSEADRMITEDYTKMRNNLLNSSTDEASLNKKLDDLKIKEESDRQTVKTLLELHTRTFQKDTPRWLRNFASLGTGINYLTRMGQSAISQITDVARLIGQSRHGRALSDDLGNMIDGLHSSFRLAPEEGARLGIIADRLTDVGAAGQRTMQLFDSTGSSKIPTSIESTMSTAGAVFSKLSGIDAINNLSRAYAAEIKMSSILNSSAKLVNGTLEKGSKEAIDLARMGVDKMLAKNILEQLKIHGITKEGTFGKVTYSNFNEWDSVVKSKFMTKLRAEVDKTIIMPTIGSRPFFMSTAQGRILLQFSSFTFASGTKLLATDAQQAYGLGATNSKLVAARIISDMALGAIGRYIKDYLRDGKIDLSPERTITYALENSAVMATLMYPNQIAENFGMGAQSLLGLKKYSKFADSPQKGLIRTLGPTASYLADTVGVLQRFSDGAASDSDMRALFRILPGNNLIYLNWAVANYGK
jgi:hypothetical protein